MEISDVRSKLPNIGRLETHLPSLVNMIDSQDMNARLPSIDVALRLVKHFPLRLMYQYFFRKRYNAAQHLNDTTKVGDVNFTSLCSPCTAKSRVSRSQQGYFNNISPKSTPAMQVLKMSNDNPVFSKSRSVRGTCKIEGCNKVVRSRRLCKAHGGGKRCRFSDCSSSDQGGGFCISHGGGKRCKELNCMNAAQSHNLCKFHGGGAPCRDPNCSKTSKGNGYCKLHWIGKVCNYPHCKKKQLRKGYCLSHGQHFYCRVSGCRRAERLGGYCAQHQDLVVDFKVFANETNVHNW